MVFQCGSERGSDSIFEERLMDAEIASGPNIAFFVDAWHPDPGRAAWRESSLEVFFCKYTGCLKKSEFRQIWLWQILLQKKAQLKIPKLWASLCCGKAYGSSRLILVKSLPQFLQYLHC